MNIFLPQHLIAKTNRTVPGLAAKGDRPNPGRTKAGHLAPAKRIGGVRPISANMSRNPQRKTSTKTIYYIITAYLSIITITCIHLKILMSYYGCCFIIWSLGFCHPHNRPILKTFFRLSFNIMKLLCFSLRPDPTIRKSQAWHTGFGTPPLRR